MNIRIFAWMFVWVTATLGWTVRIVYVQVSGAAATVLAVFVGGLLCIVLERRLVAPRDGGR